MNEDFDFKLSVSHLDRAILYFYKHNKKDYISYQELYNALKEYQTTEMLEAQLILQKLVKDGYVIEEEQIVRKHLVKEVMVEKDYGYFITFDGLLFVEAAQGTKFNQEPYKFWQANEKIKNQNMARESWPKKNWYWLLIITVLAGGFADLAKEAYKRKYLPTQLQMPSVIIAHDTVYIIQQAKHDTIPK